MNIATGMNTVNGSGGPLQPLTAEQFVIGCIFHDRNWLIATRAAGLQAGHFHDPALRAIYAALPDEPPEQAGLVAVLAGNGMPFEALSPVYGLAARVVHANPDAVYQAIGELAARPLPKTIRLIPFNEIARTPGASYIVKGLLPSTGMAVVYGPPKSGKTYWALDLMMHIALGWDYRGCRVKQRPVVYLLFEGADDFADRVEAYRRKHLRDYGADIPFYLVAVPLQIVADHAAIIDAIRQQTAAAGVVVVVDTLNRSYTGSESKDDDMVRYIQACDAIRDALHCLVILVHHSGKDPSKGARGHSALLAALDAQILVTRDKETGVITAELEYTRRGKEGAKFVSTLEEICLGQDEDGEDEKSCVINGEGPEKTHAKNSGGRPLKGLPVFRAALNEMIAAYGKDHPVLVSPGVQSPVVMAVDYELVRAEFLRRYPPSSDNPARDADAKRKTLKNVIKHNAGLFGWETTPDGKQLVWNLPERQTR